MRKTLTTATRLLFLCLFLFSCNYEKIDLEEEITTQDPTTLRTPNDGVNSFIISQNYLIRIITLSLTRALASPAMHGFQGETEVDTRVCPTVTFTTGSPNVMELDFGTNCLFTNTIGGTPDTMSGIIRLEAYGPITDPSTNTFLFFDEIKMNGKKIRFSAGNPTVANWIKFKFSGNPATSNFTYEAFIDGTVPNGSDPVFDRSQFQIIDCVTGDSLVIYPSYSGITALNFKFIDINNPGTAPVFTYASLVNGEYQVDFNPMKAFYYDANGVLVEDYNIIKGDSPLIFKPLCKWISGGKLLYDDIPTSNPNYTDMLDDPYKQICYGSDALGNESNICDRYVKVISCDEFGNNMCVVGADTTILACPL